MGLVLTKAIASDESISVLVRTDKYAILAST